MAQQASNPLTRPLTHEDVIRILGDVDDSLAAEIISSGMTSEQLADLADELAWNDEDEERAREA